MAKFCGKCGAQLDKRGNCPNCGRQQLPPKTGNDTKNKQRKKGNAGKIILVVLLCLLLASAVAGALIFFGVLDVPAVKERMDMVLKKDADVDDRDLPDPDESQFSYQPFSEENLVTPAPDGAGYLNNEILVTLRSPGEKQKLDDYLSEIGGTIVGGYEELGDFQIRLDKTYTYDELKKIVDALSKEQWVLCATLHYAIPMEEDAVTNDAKWKNAWGEVADGDNWGIEAIDAMGAWDHLDQLQTVNVGIFDDMFDYNHEDLFFAEKPLGMATVESKIQSGDLSWSSHGTHTSGTVAAASDNGLGVTGISRKQNLYGISARGLETSGYHGLQEFKTALGYLIHTKHCKVVNISLGFDSTTFNAAKGDSRALDEIREMGDGISALLTVLLNQGDEFVITKSAGNQNDPNGNYKYFRKDDGDTGTDFTYYSYSAYQKHISGKEKQNCFIRYENRQSEIEGRLEAGNIDAGYDCLSFISDPVIKSRIIVVGAVGTLGTHKEGGFLFFGRKTVQDGYQITSYSQCGSRVDVLAPGGDGDGSGKAIHSTVHNGYGYMCGTSMAAPHVAGVAALVFSANPELRGDQVRHIIVATATGAYGKEQYGLVNAKNAVEAALGYSEDDNPEPEPEPTPTPLPVDAEIPNSAVAFNGHRYLLYDIDDVDTWEKAEAYCRARGGHLATITSESENNFVYAYIHQLGRENAYFGFSDSDVEGEWAWVTGEKSTYLNWHDGEPNAESSQENYAMFYYKYQDGTWNDGSFGQGQTVNDDTAFICEWDGTVSQSDQPTAETTPQPTEHLASGQRDVVLVLDVSGSMSGDPLSETKKAATNFVQTVLQQNASVGIVTYNSRASVISDFSMDEFMLTEKIDDISVGGATNIEAGLSAAYSMLLGSHAEKKIIVLMSDGMPNEGKEGSALTDYADSIKADDVYIYTLGFFSELSEGEKISAQALM